MKTTNEFEGLTALSEEEMKNLDGGIFLKNVWEVLGYAFTYHAREVMYSDNAPSVLAYK